MTFFTVPLLAYLALSPPSSRLWVLLVLVWQLVVAVLWAAASGTMGKQTLDGRQPEALKASFGFALVEMICFLIGCYGIGGNLLWGQETSKAEWRGLEHITGENAMARESQNYTLLSTFSCLTPSVPNQWCSSLHPAAHCMPATSLYSAILAS